MAPSGRDQGVGFRGFRAGCFEKHQLRLSIGVFSLKGSRISQHDRADFLEHSHRTDISGPEMQDHNLFRVNIQVHDSRLRKLSLRNSDVWQQEPYRYQMHQTQTNFHLTSLSELVFVVLGLILASQR
jgi:hypothetical protein